MNYIFLIICLVLTFVQCADKGTNDAADQTETETSAPTKNVDYTASTAKMATLIAKSFANMDPAKATFLIGRRRLDHFKAQGNSSDLSTRITAWIYYANELLNVGDNAQAIVELELIQTEIKKLNINVAEETVLLIRRQLAVAYLRLAEVDNCVTTRNHASCILPISKEGQYKMTAGSEAAMKHCLAILKDYPDDAETIWLLNLAAMTIGKYPQGVPAQWRIPESSLKGVQFPRFKEISHKVGIKGQSLAGGTCVEDFDNDGWIDILTSSWGGEYPLVFWKNTGQGTFTDASASLELTGINGGLNMIHADINNDGLADVLVLRGAWLREQGKIPNSLLLNLGNGKFADITISAGVLTYAATQTGVFADFNLDGWIDFFVGNESSSWAQYPNEFYLNNKDNTFTNVITKIGTVTEGYVKGCVAGDINNDGWPDLYLSKYGAPNMLLLNKGLNAEGLPQFENIAHNAKVEEPIHSFPTWIWDYDNDGWEDIFVSGYGEGDLTAARDFVANTRGQDLKGMPRIYRNNGDNTFQDMTAQLGMRENIYTMGSNFGDLDGDGYMDCYLGTGAPEYTSVVPNKVFRNNAGKRFDDITASGGFGNIQKGHAVGFGDLDRDGDEDIFESMGGAYDGDIYEDLLFENHLGQDKSWIVLKLEGVQSNRAAIGARVKVTVTTPTGSKSFYRVVSTGGSFGSNSLQLEIGLDNATKIEKIEILWPNKDRTKQLFENVKMNSYIHITEGANEVEYREVVPVEF